MFDHLCERGLDFSQPRLYLIDGSRALHVAIERHAGQAAFIQRCQVHKIRNILAYLPETRQHWFKYKLRLAYAHADISDAPPALYRVHDEFERVEPECGGQLNGGFGGNPHLHDLQVHARLRRSLSSTNGIESSFSVVETICRGMKRWQGSDHRLRWVASALLYAETRWNRLRGYRHLPLLVHNLQHAYDMRCNPSAITLAAHLPA